MQRGVAMRVLTGSKKLLPESVRLTDQQLCGTFPESTGLFTARVSAVFQEELKQRLVVVPQLPPQEEVASQPAVKVLDQTAGPHNLIGCRPGANGLNGLCRNFPLHR
jgi:hypothetical protein